MQPDTLAGALTAAGIPYKQNEPLAPYTSFCIGGPAKWFVEPENEAQLARALAVAREGDVNYLLLGKGSNILFLDDGFDGMIVHIAEALGEIESEGDRVTAGAGANLMAVCRAAQRAGLAGLEFAYGIPGSVGGAVYMNAGAYGGETRDVLESVRYLDENGVVFEGKADQLQLGYRCSVFQRKPWAILSATYRLQQDEPAAIDARMQDYMQRRRDKQPLDKPSAGSAFKRPEGAFAGALIDQCGLRGYRVGDAAISEKHCGFIVNLGSATCRDVLALADEVCQRVKEQTGYNLEKEIRVIGL